MKSGVHLGGKVSGHERTRRGVSRRKSSALVLTAAETLQGLADSASLINVTLVGWEKEV